MVRVNAHGVKIGKLSTIHKSFEAGGVPLDITKEDVNDWKRQHDEAMAASGLPAAFRNMMPIDVAYSGCWLGKELRARGASEERVAELCRENGASMDFAGFWTRARAILEREFPAKQ